MSEQIIYTQPTRIETVKDPRTVKTQWGDRHVVSFCDNNKNWYSSWNDTKEKLEGYKNQEVIIGYTLSYYNDKEGKQRENRTIKSIGVVGGEAPQNAPQAPKNANNTTEKRHELYGYVLSYVKDLIVAGKVELGQWVDVTESVIERIERGKQDIPLEDDIRIEDIPF